MNNLRKIEKRVGIKPGTQYLTKCDSFPYQSAKPTTSKNEVPSKLSRSSTIERSEVRKQSRVGNTINQVQTDQIKVKGNTQNVKKEAKSVKKIEDRPPWKF